MAERHQREQLIRFGVFEVDRKNGELRKRGVLLKLQDLPFRFLAVLLEVPGEIVPREELIGKLWPNGTYVDHEQSLGSAVYAIRQALGDSADSPRFVETIPRRGYRFIPTELVSGSAGNGAAHNGAPRITTPHDPLAWDKVVADTEESDEFGASPVATTTPSGFQHIVGRSEERALLARAFDSAASGVGRVVCIAGEPGIGKTTLIEDFLTGLNRDSRQCFISTGKCSQRLAGTEAYLPVIEALENLTRADSTKRAATLLKRTAPTWYLQVAPVAAASDPSLREVLVDARVASQQRMKREMYAFLRDLSAVGPVVLFLDDLHWADPSTVDLLFYIGHRCESARLLILGTYRPSDLLLAQHPFLQVKQELQGRGICQELELGFLGRDDIECYLSLEFPDHDFPAEFVELVESRTEGSPLFMVGVLRDLRVRGAITKRDGGWTLSESVSSIRQGMPESVRALIERKISRLEARDRELLIAASVQGQEFDSATVGAAAEIDPAEVEERLADVARVHQFVSVIEETEFPDSTITTKYSFVHALYHNALYETLRQRQRISLSAKVAGALLRFHGDRSHEVASELAYLLATARRWEQASDYFLLAADNAAKVYANEEAMALSQKAVEQAERLPEGSRRQRVLDATFKLAELHLTVSDLEAAGGDFRLAAQVAEEAGRHEAQIDAICGAALAEFVLKRTDNTRVLAERALEVAREADSAYGTASAEVVLAMERMCGGDISGSTELVARAQPVLMDVDRRPTPLHVIEAVVHCAGHKRLSFTVPVTKAGRGSWKRRRRPASGPGKGPASVEFPIT